MGLFEMENVVPACEGKEIAIADKLIAYSGKPAEYSIFMSFVFFFVLPIGCAFSKMGVRI
jgi:hypothetical protein